MSDEIEELIKMNKQIRTSWGDARLDEKRVLKTAHGFEIGESDSSGAVSHGGRHVGHIHQGELRCTDSVLVQPTFLTPGPTPLGRPGIPGK